MNKQANLFAGVAIVIAISLVVYIGVFKVNRDKSDVTSSDSQTAQASDRDIFSYVPADTIFFFGGLSTVSFEEAANVMTPGNEWMIEADWSKQFSDEEKKLMPPAALMFSSLTSNYIALLKEPQSAGARMGLGDKIDAVTYSIGFIPVMRIRISDATAFNSFIDGVETQAGVTATKSTIGDMNLRSYSLDAPGSQDKTEANLIVGSNNQYAIFSLATKVEDARTRELIVGATKPANPINAASTLNPIKSKYSFNPAYIGYVNHQEIMKGITGDGNGEFGRMLDSLISMAQQASSGSAADSSQQSDTAASENDNPLQSVRNEACKSELLTMVKSWPQTVFGYTKMDFASQPKVMDAKMVVEGTDTEFMKSMQTIRGYIPEMLLKTSSEPVFGFGFGINMDALSPFVAKASQDFISKDYQCDFLAQIKQNLVQSNPAMALGMMSGMVSGVQGISVTILDVDGNLDVSQPGAMPQINKLDAIITISSSNPQQLLMMAANMQPGMPPIQLPADGTPIDLPVPLPVPALAQAKMALKGSHIVAYVGEKATQMANQLANEPIRPSGLFAVNIDFGKYMSLIAGAARESATATSDNNQPASLSDKEKAMLDAMSNTRMQLVEVMDIQKEGIAFDVKMQTE